MEKKLDDAKKLSMDELDAAAGGSLSESSRDSKFLHALSGICDRYGKTKLFFSGDSRDEVRQAWAAVGVSVIMNFSDDNEYWINGVQVSQDKAMEYAQKKMGVTLDPKTWDYD